MRPFGCVAAACLAAWQARIQASPTTLIPKQLIQHFPWHNLCPRFAAAIHAQYPGKLLAYNCSPSFNWKKKLSDDEIAKFQKTLGSLGYKFQFITLAGFHSLNYGMFSLARDYASRGGCWCGFGCVGGCGCGCGGGSGAGLWGITAGGGRGRARASCGCLWRGRRAGALRRVEMQGRRVCNHGWARVLLRIEMMRSTRVPGCWKPTNICVPGTYDATPGPTPPEYHL